MDMNARSLKTAENEWHTNKYIVGSNVTVVGVLWAFVHAFYAYVCELTFFTLHKCGWMPCGCSKHSNANANTKDHFKNEHSNEFHDNLLK